MDRIIYTQEDGTVAVIVPAQDKTAAQCVHNVPKGTAYKLIPLTGMPKDREFRGAWVDETPEDKVDICCDRAKNIALEKLRKRRNKKLDSLDKDFMMALEKGEDLNAIKSEKQSLRDVTDPLKNLNTSGKINDESILQQIRDLRDVEL